VTTWDEDPRDGDSFYWLSKHSRETVGAYLWLDDTREAPPGWDRTHHAAQAILALNNKEYEIVSLDHDLEYAHGHNEETGLTVVEWMVDHDRWPSKAIHVHSWNPAGAQAMCDMINRYGPYEKLVRPTPATSWPN
jgi:hypothetical protein